MELKLDVTRKTVLKAALVMLLMMVVAFGSFTAGVNLSYLVGYREGHKAGFGLAIQEVNKLKDKTGLEFNWTDLGDGQYAITAFYKGALIASGIATVHLSVEHWRNGVLLSSEFGSGVLTNIGKDWIEKQISGTVNASQQALYCADSNDATDPPLASWTILPSEITTNGLDRQTGTYTSTGVGTWNVTVTKSVTGTQSTQLWGLHWVATDNSDNNLLAADSGPAQKNCVSGDTLKETWQVSVS